MKLKIFRDNEKAKYNASRLPSTWPSHLHNKCNVPTCQFPNSPQAADGTYNCRGFWSGQSCEGTYYVSPSTAASVMKISRDQMARDEQARKWKAQKDAEIERQKVVKGQLDEQGTRLAAEELSAKYEEKRRDKGASTGSTIHDPAASSYLARRAAQRRRPTDIIPTDTTIEQRLFSTYGLVHSLDPCPLAVNGYFEASVGHTHSPQTPSPSSSRARSKSSAQYPSPSFEYSSPQYRHTETHGKSQSRF